MLNVLKSIEFMDKKNQYWAPEKIGDAIITDTRI